MRGLLQTLNAAPDIEFEKCGEIIWAPKRNVFVCCCWHCQDFFTGMLAFTRHVRRHRELDDWQDDDEDASVGEEEQEGEEEEVTNVLEDSEKSVSVYTVEELLADKAEQEYWDSKQLLEQQVMEKHKNVLQLKARPENAIANESAEQDAAGSGEEVIDSREYRENSIFMCELQGDEMSIIACNEYDDEISALMQCDAIETIEYSVDEVEKILEADELLSVSAIESYEHSKQPIADVGAKQTTMDSGLGLEETLKTPTRMKHNLNESLNLMANTALSNPTIVNATAKKLDVPIKLVEAFYKDFKPRSKKAPIKLANKRRNGQINSKTFKNWNMHDEKSNRSDDNNSRNMHNNNNHNMRDDKNSSNMRNNNNNLNAADNPLTLSTVGDKPLSLLSSAKAPGFANNAVDSDFLAALQLTSNISTNMTTMKQEVLAQSTPKANPQESAQNAIAGIRSEHFGAENTIAKKIYSFFKSYTKLSKTPLLERTPLKCVSSSLPDIARKRQMLERMQHIKRNLLQATDKENQPKNPSCNTLDVRASDKQLAPNGTLPEILSIEVLNSGNLPQSGGKELASKSAESAATVTDTPSVGNFSDVSVEFLQHSMTRIVNLSAFDCILNDVTYTPLDTSTSAIDSKPNTSLEIIKVPDDVELNNGLQKSKFNFDNTELDSSLMLSVTTADSSQLNHIVNSAANTTTKPMDDMVLLDLVGLKIIQKPEVENELTLAQVEAMRFRAFQFATIFQKTSEIWINRLHVNKSHEQVDTAFAKLTAETNAFCHGQLATHHLKRIVNVITMWYSCCHRARLISKKHTPAALASYLQFFAFLPKTGRRSYYCEFCPLNFRAETRYMQHRTEHTGQQPYSCQHCQRNFVRRKSLQNHEMSCYKLDTESNDAAAESTMHCATNATNSRARKA